MVEAVLRSGEQVATVSRLELNAAPWLERWGAVDDPELAVGTDQAPREEENREDC